MAARVAAIVPLCLSWLSFSLRLSLLLVFLYKPISNSFSFSLFLLVGLLKCRTAKRDRQESLDQTIGGVMTCILSGVQDN